MLSPVELDLIEFGLDLKVETLLGCSSYIWSQSSVHVSPLSSMFFR